MTALSKVQEQTLQIQELMSSKQVNIENLASLSQKIATLTNNLSHTSKEIHFSHPVASPINCEMHDNPITRLLMAIEAAKKVQEMQEENPLLQQAILTTEKLVTHLQGQLEQVDKEIEGLQKLVEEKKKTLTLINQLTKEKV